MAKTFEQPINEEAEVLRLTILLKKKLNEAVKSGKLVQVMDRVGNFGNKLKTKYPDHDSYELFHLLGLSGLKSSGEKFDFPEEDSVRGFIESL